VSPRKVMAGQSLTSIVDDADKIGVLLREDRLLVSIMNCRCLMPKIEVLSTQATGQIPAAVQF